MMMVIVVLVVKLVETGDGGKDDYVFPGGEVYKSVVGDKGESDDVGSCDDSDDDSNSHCIVRLED